jgi:hypothetical protein
VARLRSTRSLLVAGALVAAGLVAPAYAGDGVDAIDGPLTSGDSLFPNQGNGGYDVSHYDLDFDWTPSPTGGTIDATTTIEATTTGEPLSSFGLDLEGLTVGSVTVDGISVPPAGIERINQADGPFPGQRKLRVTPTVPVEGDFTVVVHYSGDPTERGGETAGSDEGWITTSDGATFMNQPIGSMTGFPNNNTPSDKATYTISVTVPDTYEVASNGELSAIPPTGGPRTWVWNQTRPMASELVLISIGQYDVKEDTVTLSGSREIPEWSFVDSAMTQPQKATFESQRQRLSAVLTGLEAFLGPYPGQSTGIVLDPTGVGYALETQDRPTWSTPNFISSSFVHELAHQWYGDAVAPQDWNGIWVNEGMATWAPVRYGTGNGNGNTESEFFGEWSSTSSGNNLWKTPPSGMTDPDQLFGWQSYDRGAMTYEALRAAIGDPAFFQLIKQWQTDFGGQSKRWTDLIDLAEELSGKDLTAFFKDWIYDADKPAWPGKLNLALAAAPGAGPVEAGSSVSYTLTAKNTGRVPLTGAVVEVDLSHVLDHATIGALPAGVSLAGTTLTWTVPTTALAGVATTSFPVTVLPTAAGTALAATASVKTLGGTCVACAVTHTVVPSTAPSAIGAACQVRITGKARVGRTLRAATTGCPPGAAFTYRWFAGSKALKGAHGAAYKVKRSTKGKRIRVRVTVSAPGYVPAERVSPRTRKVR